MIINSPLSPNKTARAGFLIPSLGQFQKTTYSNLHKWNAGKTKRVKHSSGRSNYKRDFFSSTETISYIMLVASLSHQLTFIILVTSICQQLSTALAVNTLQGNGERSAHNSKGRFSMCSSSKSIENFLFTVALQIPIDLKPTHIF